MGMAAIIQPLLAPNQRDKPCYLIRTFLAPATAVIMIPPLTLTMPLSTFSGPTESSLLRSIAADSLTAREMLAMLVKVKENFGS